jgi:hypothetical protein
VDEIPRLIKKKLKVNQNKNYSLLKDLPLKNNQSEDYNILYKEL